ncbi:putative cytosol aminopeptidase [Devosia pacifica]|uniref:Probable cytosol aminopeptidase n=1 Tax=Devosia pacifica TaxID=1335967 RepID=A0A918SCB0_9HYPH|nr:leucyl aminopeptidase [Devosia pacifica]GHA35367.1 putative cytosol aminopeptidase [Devosia pacifica]
MSQPLFVQPVAQLPADSDVVVIYAFEAEAPQGAGGEIWSRTGLDWQAVSESAGFKGKQGQMLDLVAAQNLDGKRLVVLGAGKPSEPTEALTAFTDRGGSLMGKLTTMRAADVAVQLDDASPAAVAELVAGLHLRHYKFDKYKSASKEDAANPAMSVRIVVDDVDAAQAAIADRMAVAEGTILARDLVNEPANTLGTVEFAERASALSELGVEVEVLGLEELQALGMNSMLAVSQGSARPPRLVIMRWNNGAHDEAPVAFVGKGVVFDTGGISIKPAGSMEDMKGDMGGAAAVTGLMHALAKRKARINAVGVIGLVENMPSSTAMRPGDIVKAMSGTTIEIINTDAEGRLVLADALWYTQDRFKPKFMIDLATLTGAVIVALGHEHGGLYANDEALATQLLRAGRESNEKLWRMPLDAAYDKLIESRFADIKNTGGRPAGSITAAQFLQRFVNSVPWAHLDIASTAFGPRTSEINTSWAPGFGVALLDRLLRDDYEAGSN